MSNYKKTEVPKEEVCNNTNSKKKNYSKNGKNARRSKSRTMSSDKFDARKATNNPAWYGADPALLRDSASLPFSYAVGTPINLHNGALDTLPSGQEFTIPGFMTLCVKPSVGWADDPSDPINVAAFRIYTYVRHLNSGHTNYDAPDLMLYLLAMSQVYSYINFLQRAYGIVYTYAQKNRYLPNALLQSMGIDPEDVRANLAQFRYGINVLINKAASLCVPGTMAIFAQQSAMYQNLYIEGDSIKDQMYMYCPHGFWKYKLNADASGMLEYVPFLSLDPLRSVDSLIEYGSDMLARLIQSEDMNIMSGDIRKAYGDGALIKLVPLNVDFPISPIKDLAVLQQIKNTTVVRSNSGLDIIQDKTHGYLVHKPSFSYTQPSPTWLSKGESYAYQTYAEDKILSVLSTDPTPEEVMEISRNIPAITNYKRSADWTSVSYEIHGGAVIIENCFVWDYKIANGQPVLRTTGMRYTQTVDTTDSNAIAGSMRLTALLGHFKYHPVVHLLALRPGSTEGSFNVADGYLMYDVDNYTIINSTTIERMNEAALLSMLNVPTVTKVQ